MTKTKPILAIALLATAIGAMPMSAQDSTQARRRELEARRRQLTEELRDVDRELGRNLLRGFVSMGDAFPRVLTWASSRAQLGVFVQTRSDDETDRIGAVLESVTPGGPADEAGLQAGDIVVSFNGTRLAGENADVGPGESGPARRLIEMVGERDEGDEVAIEYQRDGRVQRTTATLRKLDENMSVFSYRGGNGQADWNLELRPPMGAGRPRTLEVWPEGGDAVITALVSGVWADIELVSLNAQLGSYFGTSEGLLVIQAPDREGVDLRGGDVILTIDGREPRSPSRALRILRSYAPGETMTLEIMRNRQRTTVRFEVPGSSEGGILRQRVRMR